MTWLYHCVQWTWGGTPFRSGQTGYNILSGPLADTVLVVAIIGWWRKHNCHVHRCHRVGWHPDPDHGHVVCRRHHPNHPSGGGRALIEGDDDA